LQYLVSPVQALVTMPRWVWMVVATLTVGSMVSFGAIAEVPEGLLVGPAVSRAVDRGVDWMVVKWDVALRAFNVTLLQYLLLPLERWLLRLPWWLVTGVIALVSYRMVGPVFAVLAAGMVAGLAVFGLYHLAMTTLAIVITSTVLTVVLGVPTGILAAKSDRFDGAIRPLLDLMQTMPSFVYLIPVIMLFGIGKVPGVIAVVIYAVPPIIRLTNLGIRQVDASVLEAARAFGATDLQLLLKVQLPLALPTIMAGLNQTIMMALAMVVVTSMIGAPGLGVEVLNGIARLEVGRGLLGGIGIVIMAIILDRTTQGLARPRQPLKGAA
jgi:glycine betaine/proline transport system permease protein